MSIRPLPDEVVAQIKSSTAIVSLTGVVLELLKNSLDARASKIDVTVDFARGGCTIEDDGLGIAPAEFREDGGLGKLYCTSKYQSDEPHFGQHGTFLASLSAMSLLTVTSHHYAYRSHNSISFHHSQAIERQTPTTAHDHVHGKHGTRVTVRNLFGNMPAGYIGIDKWASWVPASASTAVLSIKGAISLEPSPSKHVQFMSFGLRPLFSNNGHNELYDQVNRLFALSSFGILEDDADIDDQEKLRRQSDRRFKNDGYTNRQLKARKGVDRYPMFHLQISVKDGRISDSTADRFVEDETNLQAVVENSINSHTQIRQGKLFAVKEARIFIKNTD
ncbi:DNA mismatch repair protein [Ascochyta clinopodiicola]|nr:DNA mismatch repair protein [Ascochyta clinopodiicola]